MSGRVSVLVAALRDDVLARRRPGEGLVGDDRVIERRPADAAERLGQVRAQLADANLLLHVYTWCYTTVAPIRSSALRRPTCGYEDNERQRDGDPAHHVSSDEGPARTVPSQRSTSSGERSRTTVRCASSGRASISGSLRRCDACFRIA